MVLAKLLYPIFLDCCKYTDDNFWKFIFEDLAYGKSPYGTYITKNFLCCNYKGKEFSYKIDLNKDSKILYDEIFNILHNKFGLLSQKDKLKCRKIFNLQQNFTNDKDDWSSLRKKNIKIILIEKFVINKKKKHKLSFRQTRKLFSTILIGLIFKTISKEHIDYSNGDIQSIEGINFKDSKIILHTDIYNSHSTPSFIVKEEEFLSNLWPKYLTKLQKYKK